METPIALECIFRCESHGKIAFMQEFELPRCGNIESYFLFGAKDKPVIVFPLTENKEVVAVQHFRYGANCVVLEMPGGNVEGKMTRKEAAKKELLQETGYTSDDIIPVGPETWFDLASFRVHFFPMLASKCRKVSEPIPEKTEFLEPPLLIPFHQWVEMIRSGEICDSKTLAITMMVLCHLHSAHIIEFL